MPAPASPVTVLIVDDDQGLLRLIEKSLRREGYTTATAASGKDAIDWLVGHQADLMLLDLKLQDIEGKELINHLTSIQRLVPFIIITGQGDERVAVDMMKRGALDYLVKDVRFQEFVPTVVRRALDHLDKEKRLAEAEDALRQSEANLRRAQAIAHIGSYELVWPLTSKGDFSEEVFRILGLDPAPGVPSAEDYLRRLVHPQDRSRVREALEQSLATGTLHNIEYRIVRPDGTVRDVHSIAEPVHGPDGRIVKLSGTLMDITERKRLEKEVLEISDREQHRIGHDLHDGLGQQLTGIELMCQVLEQTLAAKSKAEARHAAEIAQCVREAITHARGLARGLSPVAMESEGLMSALQELAATTEKVFRVSCQFHCDPPVLVRHHAVAMHLFRIPQEAVSNAIKHGKARRIEIQLKVAHERTVLSVKDYGVGFPKKLPRKRGLGLLIMHYRTNLIGGSLVIEKNAEGGTTVTCSLQANGNHHAEETA